VLVDESPELVLHGLRHAHLLARASAGLVERNVSSGFGFAAAGGRGRAIVVVPILVLAGGVIEFQCERCRVPSTVLPGNSPPRFNCLSSIRAPGRL
jgi:hypothetical protein